MELEFANFLVFPSKCLKVLVQTFLCPSLLTTDLFFQLIFCEHPGSSPQAPMDSQLTSEKTFLEQILNQIYFYIAWNCKASFSAWYSLKHHEVFFYLH